MTIVQSKKAIADESLSQIEDNEEEKEEESDFEVNIEVGEKSSGSPVKTRNHTQYKKEETRKEGQEEKPST